MPSLRAVPLEEFPARSVRLPQRLPADLEREDAHRDHQQDEQAAYDRIQIIVERDPLHLLDRLRRCEHVPFAAASLNFRASATKPMRGSVWKIFWTPAVSVVTSSHTVGTSVTQTNRSRFIFTSTLVHNSSAMAASIWLPTPKSCHSVLMPPSGSTTP